MTICSYGISHEEKGHEVHSLAEAVQCALTGLTTAAALSRCLRCMQLRYAITHSDTMDQLVQSYLDLLDASSALLTASLTSIRTARLVCHGLAPHGSQSSSIQYLPHEVQSSRL